jgi:hypothetical protein
VELEEITHHATSKRKNDLMFLFSLPAAIPPPARLPRRAAPLPVRRTRPAPASRAHPAPASRATPVAGNAAPAQSIANCTRLTASEEACPLGRSEPFPATVEAAPPGRHQGHLARPPQPRPPDPLEPAPPCLGKVARAPGRREPRPPGSRRGPARPATREPSMAGRRCCRTPS